MLGAPAEVWTSVWGMHGRSGEGRSGDPLLVALPRSRTMLHVAGTGRQQKWPLRYLVGLRIVVAT